MGVPLSEYQAFFRELRSLMGQLRSMGAHLHGEHGLSQGERTLLADLARRAPCTMPDLARGMPVSRQHVQAVIQRLVQAGWIRQRPNPAHRRSFLLELTEQGAERLQALRGREEEAMAALDLPLVPGELEALAQGLTRVREAMVTAIRDHKGEVTR